MQEVKFRAWNDIDKTMIQWEVLKANPEILVGIITGKVKHHFIRQYTGFKDCNGVEIYKGDIFYSDSYPFTSDDMVNYRGVVVFEEGTYYYDMYAISNRVRGTACGGILAERASESTVIGNIHENPELLKEI